MTKTPNRRQYLKSVGIGAVSLAGLSSPAAAKKNTTLADPPGYLTIYTGGGSDAPNDPNEADDFGFPEAPFFGGVHPGGGNGIVGGNEIRITPNRRTLHHDLRLFGGLVMEDKPKPYVLVNQGGGLFESRGQIANFTARPADAIYNAIVGVLNEDTADYLMSPGSPLSTLAGKKWRGVATDRMDVEVEVDEPYANDAITRVDFYERGRGKPEYTLSLLYVLWNDPAPDPSLAPSEIPGEMPGETETRTEEVIEGGRLNMGGQ